MVEEQIPPSNGSPALASTIPSLSDWTDDLDVSPFVDSSDEEATDYSEVMSLTSHSGNKSNQGQAKDEEWVVQVEDRTITISRLVVKRFEMDKEYEQDSASSGAASSSSSSSASSASSSSSDMEDFASRSTTSVGNLSGTTDPGAVVALLKDSKPPMFRNMDSTTSSRTSQTWIADSLHAKRMENMARTASSLLAQQQQRQEPSDESSAHSTVDPAPFIERMNQIASTQPLEDDTIFSEQEASSTSASEMILLDIEEEDDNIDDKCYYEEEVIEEEEEITIEEECEHETLSEPKQVMVLCEKQIRDHTVNERQQQTIRMLENNNLPYDVLYGDDPDNFELRDLLFQLSGTHNVYPQLFICTPGGETSYWGDWEDLMDNSESASGQVANQSNHSLESATSTPNQAQCEFEWEQAALTTDFSSSSQTRYEEKLQEIQKDAVILQNKAGEVSNKKGDGSNVGGDESMPAEGSVVHYGSHEEMTTDNQSLQQVGREIDDTTQDISKHAEIPAGVNTEDATVSSQEMNHAESIHLDSFRSLEEEKREKLGADLPSSDGDERGEKHDSDSRSEGQVLYQTRQTTIDMELITVKITESKGEPSEDGSTNRYTSRDGTSEIETCETGVVQPSPSERFGTTSNAVDEKFAQPGSIFSAQSDNQRVYSKSKSSSLFNGDTFAVNERPIRDTSFAGRIEASLSIEPSDAMMGKIMPTSKICAPDAMMSKALPGKLASNAEDPKVEKKNRAEDTIKNVKSKVLVQNPTLNCYQWYNRMGRPTRSSMKRRVNELPESCGVELMHVDLLPWDATGSTLLHRAVRDMLLGNKGNGQ